MNTYNYVDKTGAMKQVQASNPNEAIKLAPNREKTSGVQLVQPALKDLYKAPAVASTVATPQPKVTTPAQATNTTTITTPTTPSTTPTTPSTTPTTPSTSISNTLSPYYNQTNNDIYSSAIQYNKSLAESTLPTEEEAQAQALRNMQAEIDATNALYADKLKRAQQVGTGLVGQTGAIQARRGLLGSDFGTAQAQTVQQGNEATYASIENEKALRISEIMSQARETATRQLAEKRAAKEQGLQNYVAYLSQEQKNRENSLNTTVQDMLLNGISLKDFNTSEIDNLAKSYGVTGEQLKSKFTQSSLKAEQEKAKLEADKLETENKNRYKTIADGTQLYDTLTGKIIENTRNFAPNQYSQDIISNVSNVSTIEDFMSKIAAKETGGYQNPYTTLSSQPTIRRKADGTTYKDWAYGKFQIMGDNIPVWSKEVLGYSVTPQQFLNSPELQEQIARGKMQQYYDQYGNWQDVASKWHSGVSLSEAQAQGRKDVLGTTTAAYVNDVVGRQTLSNTRYAGTYSPIQEKVISSLDDKISKNETYKKTGNMRAFGDNVNAALSLGTGAGDLAAINQFQKVIDEGAVTRDQDVKLIQNSQSLLNRLGTFATRLQAGEQLSPELRNQMREAVNAIYAAQITALNKDPYIQSKKNELKRYNINEEDTIIGNLGAFSAASPAPKSSEYDYEKDIAEAQAIIQAKPEARADVIKALKTKYKEVNI